MEISRLDHVGMITLHDSILFTLKILSYLKTKCVSEGAEYQITDYHFRTSQYRRCDFKVDNINYSCGIDLLL